MAYEDVYGWLFGGRTRRTDLGRCAEFHTTGISFFLPGYWSKLVTTQSKNLPLVFQSKFAQGQIEQDKTRQRQIILTMKSILGTINHQKQ